jgi:glutaredoxin
MLKAFLRQNNIDYVDMDVSMDYNAAVEMIRKSGQRGVPVADINGNIVVGFDQQRIKSLLNLN